MLSWLRWPGNAYLQTRNLTDWFRAMVMTPLSRARRRSRTCPLGAPILPAGYSPAAGRASPGRRSRTGQRPSSRLLSRAEELLLEYGDAPCACNTTLQFVVANTGAPCGSGVVEPTSVSDVMSSGGTFLSVRAFRGPTQLKTVQAAQA